MGQGPQVLIWAADNVLHDKQVQGSVLVLYVYQLRTDEKGVESVSVEKVTFRKELPVPANKE